MVLAGGRVDVLAHVLHLFNVAAAIRSPVIAWSAGAMALAERIVLFGDRAPQGPGFPEVHGSGLSLVRGAVLLPHARARLRLDDAPRMAVMARRFAPDRCVLLDPGRAGGHRRQRQLAAGHPGARRGRPGHRHGGGGVMAVASRPASGKLAINRLRDRRPLLPVTIDRFLARHEIPIVEGSRCTFLYRGEADEVFIVHRTFGLPDHLPLRRLRGTDLWYAVLELPDGSRIEYQLEVVRGGHRERMNDPLNPRVAHSPVGSSSVCYARGYEVPDWTRPDPEARPGSLAESLRCPAGRCGGTRR